MLDIGPYLIVKREQCALLLEFCLTTHAHSLYKNFDPKRVERNVEIYNELKSLKQPLATTN